MISKLAQRYSQQFLDIPDNTDFIQHLRNTLSNFFLILVFIAKPIIPKQLFDVLRSAKRIHSKD